MGEAGSEEAEGEELSKDGFWETQRDLRKPQQHHLHPSVHLSLN